MAKQSPAKIKKLRGEAMRAAAQRKAEKAQNPSAGTNSEVDLDAYAAVDGAWRELGLAAPARRALIDEGLYKVSDLRKYSLDAIKDLHGMGPNAIRILITAMKKSDISFRR
jgi:DNA-nicking Smr family endonuclease